MRASRPLRVDSNRTSRPENYFQLFVYFDAKTTCAFWRGRYSAHMQDATNIPSDLASCQTLILQQASTISELNDEMEKLKKLLIQYVKGHRSEKRVLNGTEVRESS